MATNMVIMIGLSLRVAPSMAASPSACPRARELVDVLHHDHAGLNRNAEQGQKADARRYAEVRTGDVERQQPAHARHADVDQVQRRPLGRTEGAA